MHMHMHMNCMQSMLVPDETLQVRMYMYSFN